MLERVVRCLAVALVLSIITWIWDGTRFAWHPTLMAFGFLGLMSEGVLSALRLRSTEAGPERVRGILRHAAIQAAALICIAGGFYAIYSNKVLLGKPHFRTLHGRFGLAALLLGIAAPLGGVLSFKSLGLLKGASEPAQTRVKWVHRKLGLVTWLCALAAVELALTHPAVYKGLASSTWQLAVLLLAGCVSAASVLPAERSYHSGLVNQAWQLAVAGAAAAVVALAARAVKRRPLLPEQADPYGVVNVADELKAL